VDSTFESLYMPAALMALENFPVEPEAVELVAHSENVTFRVTSRGNDTDYVLRLHRPGYNSIEELNSERIWAEALKDAGILIQDSLLTNHGQHFVRVDIEGTGGQRYAGMTSWLEGMLLSDYLETNPDRADRERMFHRIGEIAATIHKQSTNWLEPPGFVRRRLDLEGLLGEKPHWGRFWEHAGLTGAERVELLRGRQIVRDVLQAYGQTPDNFSLIHADLDPDNIVKHGDDMALIDFDDSAYGWHMYDIASVLIEHRAEPEFDALSAALLNGYEECKSLEKRDIEMLPAFLLIRGMATIGWYHQRPEHADAEYYEKLKNWVIDKCHSLSP
jgi:Ser/Thr protein kinase RdoA (MazF antagonist)